MSVHSVKQTIVEEELVPDRGDVEGKNLARTESSTFRHMKQAHKDARCAISGTKLKNQKHHIALEYCMAGAVDWETVKKIGTGEIKELPVLDLETDLPSESGEMWPVEESFIYMVIQFMKAKGFDFESFDPNKPETLVDSWANMLPLHEKYHTSKTHGIHHTSFPFWVFQAWPRKDGYAFTVDEVEAMKKHLAEHHEPIVDKS